MWLKKNGGSVRNAFPTHYGGTHKVFLEKKLDARRGQIHTHENQESHIIPKC